MTCCGQPRELPASIDLSAYRIVQEALTNVVKHAQTSSCRVLIGYGRDELVLEITDNGAGVPAMAGAARPAMAMAGSVSPGPDGASAAGLSGSALAAGRHGLTSGGHGIIGMRERVMLLGGEFSAGPRPGYGFHVAAHIPLTTGDS
jgi:signal transduction histidine kinase